MSEKRTPRGPVGRSMPGEKAKDFKGSMTKLIVYMKRYHTPLFFMFLFAIAGTIFNIIGDRKSVV